MDTQEIVIVSAKRTPIGSFGGCLSAVTATALGSRAIQGVLEGLSIGSEEVDEVFFGNVLSANLGQAPARQAALGAGLSEKVPCTTINKVCASGMKAITLGIQAIMTSQADIVVAGGMESMSRVPYYLPTARFGNKYGHGELVDGLLHDGLWEAYHGFPMGNCADAIAQEMSISREAQDAYALRSYARAREATEAGSFREEILPVQIPQRKGDPLEVAEDEEFGRLQEEKVPTLRPVFDKAGTVTAANASTMNDGAAAVVLMRKQEAEKRGLVPLVRIRGFADAAQAPLHFTTAPALAIPRALRHAGMDKKDVDYYEINEAFAVVALANMQRLGLDAARVNVYGGAVALGHPLGCSGARIVVTLCHVLKHKEARIGVAAICNGGGGASALVIER